MAQQRARAAVVLAAGEGKRLKSARPKVLHRVAGRSLVGHVLAALRPLGLEETVVVTSPQTEDVRRALEADGLSDGVTCAVQERPLGTGDATGAGLRALGDFDGAILVAPGDTPLLTASTLEAAFSFAAENGAVAVVVTATVEDPTGYGRVVRGDDDMVEEIVEHRDASPDDLRRHEINGGVYVFDSGALAATLSKLDRENAQAEYLLTDVVALLRAGSEKVLAFESNAVELSGVNDRAQLAEAGRLLRARAALGWMNAGVSLVDPATTYIDPTVEIEADAMIHPFTFLEGATVIRSGAEIGPSSRIVDSEIGEGACVTFAVVRGSVVGRNASVGPYASLRPGTQLAEGAHLGTFVEAKNASIGRGSKANHLAYLGDADVGAGVNIGAGTITCNWDGTSKHKTIIEDDAYISSDTMLVAPVRIGRGAATAAGSVVRGDVPADALAVGVPARIIEGKGNRMKRQDSSKEKPGAPPMDAGDGEE